MIDLHRHLEAAPHVKDLPEFVARHKINLPRSLEALRETLIFHNPPGDLTAFLQPFILHIHKFFRTPEAVKDFTKLAIKRAYEEGITYLELRFSPFYMTGIYAGHEQLNSETIIKSVIAGRAEAAREWNIQVGLILIVGRELHPDRGEQVVDFAIKYRDDICAVDLAGDENHFPPNLFLSTFSKAKAAGIPITIHAGEAGPAEYIRYAVEKLGATRIGHGLAAAEDTEVIALLRDKNIILEICPTSNWLTGAVKGHPSNHPLMRLHRAGVKVTINTDDPMLQNTWMVDELQAARDLGATAEDLEKFQTNAAEGAFLQSGLR